MLKRKIGALLSIAEMLGEYAAGTAPDASEQAPFLNAETPSPSTTVATMKIMQKVPTAPANLMALFSGSRDRGNISRAALPMDQWAERFAVETRLERDFNCPPMAPK
mmetsp:Transcript_10897/g.20589  ORF Transcript_10897/g.20589 Transcript_10897/m.20589 type:complete len:107 (-) Transcript_10897:271-591(-)